MTSSNSWSGCWRLVAGQDVEPGDQAGVVADRSQGGPGSGHLHRRPGDPAHAQVPRPTTATATRRTWRSNPRPGSSPAVDLTPANAGDGPIGVALLDGDDAGLEVLGDSAYGSGPVRADLAERGHTAVIKPWPTARNPLPRRRPVPTVTTSASTTPPAPSPAPTGTPCPSPPRATPPSGRAAWAARCDPAAPPTTTAVCSTSATTTNCSPPPAPTGAPGSASTTTGSGGPSSNAPSPGSSPTATAESATAASNATGSDSAIRAAAINLRRLLNLGLTHSANGWTLAT